MTLEQAIAALIAGKKVRNQNWPAGQYIHCLNKKLVCHNGVGYHVSLDDLLNLDFRCGGNWEEYVKPVTFADVPAGDALVYCDTIYVKIAPFARGGHVYNAVELTSSDFYIGKIVVFKQIDEVKWPL